MQTADAFGLELGIELDGLDLDFKGPKNKNKNKNYRQRSKKVLKEGVLC